MKTTTLVLAAIIISISSGTALANRRHTQQNKVVTKHTTIVQYQTENWHHGNYKAQNQHRQSYNKNTIRHQGRRARIARRIRTQQLRQQQAQYDRYCNYNRHLYRHHKRHHHHHRHEQLLTSTIILPLPIPRIALFFPW